MDTMVSFTCISTYNIFGSETSTCREDGNWNEAIRLCAPSGNKNKHFIRF